MPKYVYQKRDDINCGPVCILNALKWAGHKIIKIEHIPFLEFACRMEGEEGTHDSDFDRVLRYAATGYLKVRRSFRTGIDEIYEHLKTGGAVAVGYVYGEYAHYTLIIEAKGSLLLCINDARWWEKRVKVFRRRRTVSNWLVHPETQCWFLTKTSDKTES